MLVAEDLEDRYKILTAYLHFGVLNAGNPKHWTNFIEEKERKNIIVPIAKSVTAKWF